MPNERFPCLTAPRTPAIPEIPADLNDDGVADLQDLHRLAQYWLSNCTATDPSLGDAPAP